MPARGKFSFTNLTLIGMNKDGYRINGGIGFAVEEPFLRLNFSQSDKFALSDVRNFPFIEQEIIRIQKIIDQEKVNIKARHLKCPICCKPMQRCEDNIENWECYYCEIIVFIKMVGNCKK